MAVALTSVVLVHFVAKSAALTAVAILVFAFSLAPFFVPTEYTFNRQGVTVRRLGHSQTRLWRTFRSVRADEERCLLSPFAKPHFLETTRGLLLFLDGNRREVVTYAEAMVAEERERETRGAGR